MLRFVIPLILLTSGARCSSFGPSKYSAASPAQIRFAIENKYDDTGPGAKERETAYSTYNNLEDALVAYLNDPETKLPAHEKAKAIVNLYRQNNYMYDNYDNTIPTRVDAFTGNRQKIVPIVLSRYNKYDVDPKPVINIKDMKGLHSHEHRDKDPFKWQKEHAVKPSHLNIARYNKENDIDFYRTKPDVTFSYMPPSKPSGDVKSSQEIRDGAGAAYGHYTVVQPDGRRRTVHYQADPQRGFRSSVQRVFKN